MKLRVALLTVGIAVAALSANTPLAFADDEISRYTVVAKINNDGSIDVKASLYANTPNPVVQSFATAREITDRRDYVYTITDIKVTEAGGIELPPSSAPVTTDGDHIFVTLPGILQTDRELSYRVVGAAANAGEDTAISWDFLQGLNMPVGTFEATITSEQQFSMIDCLAGDPVSPGKCTYFGGGTHVDPVPFFHTENVGAGDIVRVTMRFPSGSVSADQQIREHWTFDRAFSVAPLPLLTALGLLLLGGAALWLAHRRFGKDVAQAPVVRVAEFFPVGEGKAEFRVLDQIRPGLVGTVLDERVDPIDVTATLLDLAVRGHLRIKELPRQSLYDPFDWTLTRIDNSAELASYEKTLLAAVAGESEEAARVSTLPGRVRPVIGTVQSQLYDEVVARGWFAQRPDSTRNIWSRLGLFSIGAAVLITIVLAAWTPFGLAGLSLLALAFGVIFVAQEMPARTASGVGVWRGLQLLGATLDAQPCESLPKERQMEQISAILPYTVVLGGQERWLDALTALDLDEDEDCEDVYWYHGPPGWHMHNLPASLRNFVTTVQGTLFTR
ncbi:MAG: DUF2207 domain-containing protein [Propionibacteriaceae bacterium]|jgi:hypothetical protein|nr:DUF2207 domain-containing protein [Propionibacteriaceae bacterium]